MLRPSTWSTFSALFAGFLGAALFTALDREPARSEHCHLDTVIQQAPRSTHECTHQTSLPMVQPLSTWALDGRIAAVTTNQTTVAPGQPIAVAVTTVMPLEESAWVGIIPSHVAHGDEAVNDQHDIAYQYLEGQTLRTFVFQAPDTPGRYDFRLHSTDSNGVELASVTFQVDGY